MQVIFFRYSADMAAAGPAGPAVYRHCTRSADTDPAGEAITQAGIEFVLHPGYDIQHGLVGARWYAVALVMTVFGAAPEIDF